MEEVILEMDEVEAIKLYDIDGLEQLKAAKKMGISQPTFARIIGGARGKIAKALIFGKAIRIKELCR